MKKLFSSIITLMFITACININVLAKPEVPQNNSAKEQGQYSLEASIQSIYLNKAIPPSI